MTRTPTSAGRHPPPMSVQLIVADQRRRILVTDVDRWRFIVPPRSVSPTKSRPDHRLSYSRTRSVRADSTGRSSDGGVTSGRLFSGERLDGRWQPVQRGGVAAHDPLTLVGGVPPDRPVGCVVAAVRVVRGEQCCRRGRASRCTPGTRSTSTSSSGWVVNRTCSRTYSDGLRCTLADRPCGAPRSVHPRHRGHRSCEAALDEHHLQLGMPVERAVEHEAHHMRHADQRPRDEEVVAVRGVADRLDRDQLERRLPIRCVATGRPLRAAASYSGSNAGCRTGCRGSAASSAPRPSTGGRPSARSPARPARVPAR